VIFQDVTQVVEMEKELRRTERLAGVGQLAADMAHEVRNPLAAISGSVQMLQSGLRSDGADPERRHLMEIVVREADRLDRLIKDFLTFARPSPARSDPVLLRSLVEKVLGMFEAVRPAGVAVEVSIDPALRVQADAGQLTQLFWNLILNAVQAMPDGGPLGIAASALPEPPQEHPEERRKDAEEEACAWAEIVISDAGTGIAPNVLDRIFDPFFTTKREGSGLGLATVARIVDDHGGSLRVESQVGRGTAFRVRLRRAEGAG
jgi:two-component system sensor histidine kinase PilS (NtrC family)